MEFYQLALAQDCVSEMAAAQPPATRDAARAAMIACLRLYTEKLENRFRKLYPLIAAEVLGNGEARQAR